MSTTHRVSTTAASLLAAAALFTSACGTPRAADATPTGTQAAARATTAAAPKSTTQEIAHIKIPRSTIDLLTAALRKNDLAAAKATYEQYNAQWNGVEVYTNYRSRELYGQLETDLEATIADGLSQPTPDLARLVPASEALARKYDEVIALSEKGPALSPLFDDLAALRTVRADLRIVTSALAANDLAKAKASWATFAGNYSKSEPLIKVRSTTAESETAGAIAKTDASFKASSASVDTLKPLVATVTDRYNYGVNLLNAAARNTDLAKTTYSEADVATLTALNDVMLSLKKSLAAYDSGMYSMSGDAANAAAGWQFDKVKPALQPKAADVALKTALDNYAKPAGVAGDTAKTRALGKTAIEAVTLAQQVVVGQFWTDARLQTVLSGLPKS
ncbi:MAG: hypothetical protein WCL53_01505 [Chloroflexota bacterium]